MNMSSAAVHNATGLYRSNTSTTTTLEAEPDHSLSSPGRAPELGDIPNSTSIEYQWNGDPMDWESWPIGRPSPFVSEARMGELVDSFEDYNKGRAGWSRTTEKVLHVAEFSSSGHGEFNVYRGSPK